MNYDKIIKENEEKINILFAPYNPITGEGSLVPRFELKVTNDLTIFLPNNMLKLPLIKKIIEYGGIGKFCFYEKINKDSVFDAICAIREKYDFEYYAFTQQKCLDKKTKKYVPFKLNYIQRKTHAMVQDKLDRGEPVRLKVLKARQGGISTYTQHLFAWVQAKRHKNWNSIIIGHVEKQARYLRALYKRALKYNETETFTFNSFEGSTNNLLVNELGCIVSVGSMQKPDSVRGEDNAMAHFTELGLWRTTLGNAPEDVLQSATESIEPIADTMIVLESTAKGMGNFWHDIWREENAYTPVFLAWFEMEKNFMGIDNVQEFIDSMNENEWFLWHSGATLQGINWYRNKLKTLNGDLWRMRSENPTNEREAFQNTGRRVFNPLHVDILRKQCIIPKWRGKLEGDALNGKKCLDNIRFINDFNGELYIWEMPIKGWKNGYVVIVDPNKGVSEKADYGVITVLKRINMIKGGCLEEVARWRGRIDQDLLAWIAAQVSEFYNHSLLVIENNAMFKRKSVDDENQTHFFTVLNTIVDSYTNLYTYQDLEKIKEDEPIKWGFITNSSTKTAFVDALRTVIRDGTIIIRDIRACDELDSFMLDNNGKYNAQDKCHDDILDTLGIGLLVSEEMPMPVFLADAPTRRAKANISLDLG